VVAPEGVEDLIEQRQLIVSLNEQRAAAVENLVALVEIDVRERFGQIEDASNRDLEAEAT
jgi:stress response protein SCP2